MINEIHWGFTTYWYVVLICFTLLGSFVLSTYLRKKKVIALLTPRSVRTKLLLYYSPVKMVVKLFLLLAGLLFLSIAFLRPQIDKREHIVQQEVRNLLIALDISRSMLAKDLEPDRLTQAKNKIKELLRILGPERVGLMIFAGSSMVQCPLTTDHSAFLMFLDQIDATTIASGTTALDNALCTAITTFDAINQQNNNIIVIFTDGEDFSSNLSAVKEQLQEKRLHVVTVGVATPEGAPVPLLDKYGKIIGHQRDEQNNIVISALNEGILKVLADDSGGIYVRITTDAHDIDTIKNYVQQFEKSTFDERKITEYEDKYYLFVACSFICFLLEWFL